MRRPGLSAILIAGNVGLVLVAVVLIAWEASGGLRALSDARRIAAARGSAAAAGRAVASATEVETASPESALDPSTGSRIHTVLEALARRSPEVRMRFVARDAGLTGDETRDEL